MRALAVCALAAVSAASGQFAEVRVDAGDRAGEIRPVFGMDAPADERQAKLLLERETRAPIRVGPGSPLSRELAELPGAWLDPEERELRLDLDRASEQPIVWALEGFEDPLAEAAGAVAAAFSLEAKAAYYSRRKWFDAGGDPLTPLIAFELGAQMLKTPRRAKLQSGAPDMSALAGVSADGDVVQVLLARRAARDEEPPAPPAYALYVRNLPWGREEFRIGRYRLDAGSAGELVAEGSGRGGLARITARLEGPAVELIVLRRQSAPPGAGVIRMRRRTR